MFECFLEVVVNKKYILVIILFFCFFVGAVATVMAQETVKENVDRVPESVVVNNIQNAKPPVSFTHKKHIPLITGKCGSCHIDPAGGSELKPDFLKKPANLMEGLKNAFHGQCLECHKATNNEKAPTSCNDCHKPTT